MNSLLKKLATTLTALALLLCQSTVTADDCESKVWETLELKKQKQEAAQQQWLSRRSYENQRAKAWSQMKQQEARQQQQEASRHRQRDRRSRMSEELKRFQGVAIRQKAESKAIMTSIARMHDSIAASTKRKADSQHAKVLEKLKKIESLDLKTVNGLMGESDSKQSKANPKKNSRRHGSSTKNDKNDPDPTQKPQDAKSPAENSSRSVNKNGVQSLIKGGKELTKHIDGKDIKRKSIDAQRVAETKARAANRIKKKADDAQEVLANAKQRATAKSRNAQNTMEFYDALREHKQVSMLEAKTGKLTRHAKRADLAAKQAANFVDRLPKLPNTKATKTLKHLGLVGDVWELGDLAIDVAKLRRSGQTNKIPQRTGKYLGNVGGGIAGAWLGAKLCAPVATTGVGASCFLILPATLAYFGTEVGEKLGGSIGAEMSKLLQE